MSATPVIDVAMVEYLTNPADVLALAKTTRVHVVDQDGTVSIVIYPGTIADFAERVAPSAEAPIIEPRGTFACSVCGLDTPHWHDVDAVNRERVERHAFETAYTELARAYPDIRVSGWAHGFARRQEKDAPDPVAHPSIIPGWYDRWDTDSPAPLKGEYKNPVIQALWRFWLRAADTRTPPSSVAPMLSDEQIMSAACEAADALDATRVSEMRGVGWHATTIFDGDSGLLRFGRLVEKAVRATPSATLAFDLLKEARPYLDLIAPSVSKERPLVMVQTKCDAEALAKRIDDLIGEKA